MDPPPAEYVLLQFGEPEAARTIVPALDHLVRDGHIRVLDLVFIEKGADGAVRFIEYEEVSDLGAVTDETEAVTGVIGRDDLEYAAGVLGRDRTGALIVWEDLWAAPLLNALRQTGGVLIEGGRIPTDLMATATKESTPSS